MKRVFVGPDIYLRELVHSQQMAESAALEPRIQAFQKRTGLVNNDISLIHFRGKVFPQWTGSVKQPERSLPA